VKGDHPPQMKAAGDLEDILWVGWKKVDYDLIAFDSIRKAVRRYLRESGEGCTKL
jgi:hypothetical protein